MTPKIRNAWIEQAKRNGWGDFLGTALDVLEPFGPLGAQMLWIAQPALSLWVARDVVNELASALEEPGGIDHLREQLAETSPPGS
jgi:hypothetical protein